MIKEKPKKQNDCKTAKELADEYMEDWDNWKWKNRLLDSINPVWPQENRE